MMTHISDATDIERQVHDLRDEIARLQVRRRALGLRLGKARGRGGRSGGTYRAASPIEAERELIDERIAVLKAAARSIQNRNTDVPATSANPALRVDQIGTPSLNQNQGEQIVIRTSRLAQSGIYQKWRMAPRQARSRFLWTIGNTLMLIGIVLLLYVGGLYAQDEYGRYAARGDTDVPASIVVAEAEPYEPAPFAAPNLSAPSSAEGLVRGAIPDAAHAAHKSTVTRVIIPSIGVDSKVVEVGWDEQEQNGQQVAIWQVAEYAVGQHHGSANPGEGDNIVLAGHVGGYGKVFKDLFYVKPGDQITLYSDGQQYLYTVQEHLVLTEEGVPPEQQAANARYIAPTDHEVITLVTCWPPKGAHKFTQRVVIRAVPFGAGAAAQPAQNRWAIR
ncbi:MAG: sortase domain-bontaining protein [Roseiflexaceae bacterium]